MNTNDILVEKAMGSFKPNIYLSNVAMKYYESPNYGYRRLFPVCRVDLPSGFYYTFNKGDLARDYVQKKPNYSRVAPAVFGHSEQSYSCHVDQILLGIDRIIALPYQRAGGVDPYKERIPTLTEQIAQHQERDFAEHFFNANAWNNVWTGAAAANESQKKFKKFDDTTDPVEFFDKRAVEIRREGRRRPNKLALGMDVFVALKNNAAIKERIKYSGTTQNPAIVTEGVLAQVFGVDQVVVLDATYNDAAIGQPDNMKFVCDSKSALLLYAPDTPQIDSPSAGYLFTWNIDGSNYIAVRTYEGEPASHTELLEGIIAYDLKKTSDDLAIFFKDCCA